MKCPLGRMGVVCYCCNSEENGEWVKQALKDKRARATKIKRFREIISNLRR